MMFFFVVNSRLRLELVLTLIDGVSVSNALDLGV